MAKKKKFLKRKALKKVGKAALGVFYTAVVIGTAAPAAGAVDTTEAAKGVSPLKAVKRP